MSSDDPGPVRWTGIGSWPGTDVVDALKISFELCPELPYLPELPERGAAAQLTGRGAALLTGMAVDLQPAGWRLTDAPGRDHRRARALLRDDLDRLEEAAQDYAGPFKISVAGPWTLAATVERPRGDLVLADHGARRDLGQSLAQGIADQLAELDRRLPSLEFVLQLDEPMLPAVLAGSLSTASGFSRHRAVEPPEVSTMITHLVETVGVPVAVHCCAPDVPVTLLHQAGVAGLAVDLGLLRTRDWDAIGAAMEDGLWLGTGAVPTADPSGRLPSGDAVAQRVLRPLRTLGLDPSVAARTVITPACGLAGFRRDDAVRVLRTLKTAAGIVTEELPR